MKSETSMIKFYASLTQKYNESEKEKKAKELQFAVFRSYIWGEDGLSKLLEKIDSGKYGADLELILLQYEVFPDREAEANLSEIERYRPKERSIGIPVVVNSENFFDKNENERRKFLFCLC